MLRKSKHDLLFFFFSINDATIKIGGNMDNKEYKDILKNYVLERALNSITPNMAVKRKSKYGYFKSVSPEVRYKECDITKYLRHKSYNEVILRFKKILDNENKKNKNSKKSKPQSDKNKKINLRFSNLISYSDRKSVV